MLRDLSLCAALGAISASLATASVDQVFQEQCESDDDFGWPRFHNFSELHTSPWALYMKEVYGELPQKFPVCIYDFWNLEKAAYIKANITGHEVVDPKQRPLKNGDLYLGTLGYQIYHETWKPLADNTWVEIAHSAFPTEMKGFWVWRIRGSGVWYNIGKTKVFPTPADPSKIHQEAIKFLTENCSVKPSWRWPLMESDIFGSCAREKGFDSIQFEPQQGQSPVGTFGLPGLTEMVLVNIDGKYNCGVADASKTPLREGWMASEQCDCENEPFAESCGVMPKAPNPLFSSPLCKLQEGPIWNRWKLCNSSTCKPTRCSKRSMLGSAAVPLGRHIASPVGASDIVV